MAESSVSVVDTMQKLNKFQSKKYLKYCGNESNKAYEKGNWESLSDCLTDGRVHLVYETDERDGSGFDKFTDEDLKVLLSTILDGVDVSVTENSKNEDGYRINYKCVSVTVIGEQGTCSSAAYI